MEYQSDPAIQFNNVDHFGAEMFQTWIPGLALSFPARRNRSDLTLETPKKSVT
jgi:hypothetical protein